MPVIEVTLVEGRTTEQKNGLIRALTNAAHESIGAPLQTVRVILREIPLSHFAVGGETFAQRAAAAATATESTSKPG